MPQAARLNAALLVRKGDATPTSGTPYPRIENVLAMAPNQARCRTRIAQEAGEREPPRGATRVGVTLRLDRDRYTRLKIFAARCGESAQRVLLDALDAHLEACGRDCACLRAPQSHSGN